MALLFLKQAFISVCHPSDGKGSHRLVPCLPVTQQVKMTRDSAGRQRRPYLHHGRREGAESALQKSTQASTDQT